MYKPSLKNNWSLIGLCVLSIVLFYVVQNSKKDVQQKYYDEKILAAQNNEVAMKVLKDEVLSLGYIIDKLNDPNETGLIGTSVSSITTSRGALSERLATLNPNFAAAMIDLLKGCDLKEGDYVAVGVTGANPGANMAMYMAMETLKLKPIIIVSAGSSTYGANRELFTWLDMETALYETEMISFKSKYATLGGTNDIGRGLPPEGRDNLMRAIIRNHVTPLNGANLKENVQLRYESYLKELPPDTQYSAFINLGAGVGNVGSLVNAKIIPTGVNKKLGEKEFKEPGVMMNFAEMNIPVVHVYNVMKIVKENKLESNPYPLPKAGEGAIFSKQINNVLIAVICWIILLGAIIAVIIFDRHDRHFMSNLVDPEEDL
ncbi:MAG TPA: poly-gamma-glutamate system protein [Candidatus Cloacimonadota bacterium]|jgi:poly-gamma-glutamate system protein|nr:poly-gamma-glutamate system protein [Candidatus Cloacimonadales bacterium]HPY96153.1 poly-gamma-glutamate system protein [Candidatus Cloacimonadota bacterium]HQB41321.1 poly-gamma-glutamate system protein [Candidatus Cloacimonadota bacterium]